MSDPEPIDLSKLMSLNLAPDWVGELQKRESAPGEVVWGRAPDNERESRGGGQGQGYGGGGGGRGPRRDGGGFGQDRGGPPRGRQDDRSPRPGGPRPGGPGGFGGPRPDDRGPRPGGPAGFGGPPRGPRQDDRGPRPGGPRPDGPRGPRPDVPRPDRPQGDHGPRPAGPGGPRRDERPGGPSRGPGGPRHDGPRHDGPRHDGPRGPHPDFRADDRRGGPPRRFEGRPHIEPLPGWRVRLFAEPKSLEAIVRQVKASSRAYPVFEMGRLFLAGRDRYVVNFSRLPAPAAQRGPKGSPAPEPPPPPDGPDELFHVPADGSLWTTRDEAIHHILSGPVLQNLYRQETLSVDPPKGNFSAVAVCGFSGAILGPPNHHSFQTTVARIHREQFYNLPLDRYKSRIRTEKDEALVAKWLEEQSTTVVFVPLTAAEIAAAEAARQAAKAAAEAAKSGPTEVVVSPEANGPAGETKGEPVVESSEATAAESEAPSDPANDSGETIAAAPPAPETEAANDGVPTEGSDSPEAAGESPEAESPLPAPDVLETSGPAADSGPAIPVQPLKSHAAMEAHFLEYHAPLLIKPVNRISVSGNIPGKLLSPPLLALLRMEVEQQQRFPMQLVQDLCRDLEKENLKFFKRDKKATFVCRTRPHYIEDESHLSPRLRSIVGVIKANVGITVPKLVSVLAPHPGPPPAKVVPVPARTEVAESKAAPEPVTEAPADPAVISAEIPASETPASESPVLTEESVEVAEEPSAGGAPDESRGVEQATVPVTEPTAVETVSDPTAPATEAPSEEAAAPPAGESSAPAPPTGQNREEGRNRKPKGPKGPKPPPAPAAPPAPLTAEEIGVLQDLRWLVQEGFVTEYASGELQILGRPPQPPTPPAVKKPKSDSKADDSSVPTPSDLTMAEITPTNDPAPEPEAPVSSGDASPIAAEDGTSGIITETETSSDSAHTGADSVAATADPIVSETLEPSPEA